MKKILLATLLTLISLHGEEKDTYVAPLSKVINQDIEEGFQNNVEKNFSTKEIKLSKEFVIEMEKTYKKINDLDLDRSVSTINEEATKSLEKLTVCSIGLMVVYKENPLHGKCEKIILKDGCEIDNYIKKEHFAAFLKNCNPDLD